MAAMLAHLRKKLALLLATTSERLVRTWISTDVPMEKSHPLK